MPSSGMLLHVALVRTDVLEERITSIISVTRTGELGTTLAVTSNRSMLRRYSRNSSVLWLLVTDNVVPNGLIPVTPMVEAICSSETLVLTTATWGNSQKTVFFVVTVAKTSNLANRTKFGSTIF
jgi:hypothetical protein